MIDIVEQGWFNLFYFLITFFKFSMIIMSIINFFLSSFYNFSKNVVQFQCVDHNLNSDCWIYRNNIEHKKNKATVVIR